jgi:hypothetical protein
MVSSRKIRKIVDRSKKKQAEKGKRRQVEREKAYQKAKKKEFMKGIKETLGFSKIKIKGKKIQAYKQEESIYLDESNPGWNWKSIALPHTTNPCNEIFLPNS